MQTGRFSLRYSVSLACRRRASLPAFLARRLGLPRKRKVFMIHWARMQAYRQGLAQSLRAEGASAKPPFAVQRSSEGNSLPTE
jgi:hypothetical protein